MAQIENGGCHMAATTLMFCQDESVRFADQPS